jgi:nucleoside-diphosphate-sugar epimerase
MVDVDDVVDQLILQAEKSQAVGQAFFSSSEETTTLEELQQLAARALNKQPRTLYLPATALMALGGAADVFTNSTGMRLPVNRKLARQLTAPAWTCSIEKAKRVLGFRPRRTIAESIERSAQSYLEAGWL